MVKGSRGSSQSRPQVPYLNEVGWSAGSIVEKSGLRIGGVDLHGQRNNDRWGSGTFHLQENSAEWVGACGAFREGEDPAEENIFEVFQNAADVWTEKNEKYKNII